jgi:hypothetical protein
MRHMLPAVSHRPIVFTIAHSVRAVFTTAVGIVELADLLAHIQAKAVAGVLSYSELFDARKIVLDLSIPELFIIASEMRKATAGKPSAKIAVVVSSGFLHGLARSYAHIAISDGQIVEVFKSYDEAHAWLLGKIQIPSS